MSVAKHRNLRGQKTMDIEEYLADWITSQQFDEILYQQHYSFAHKVIPYILENHFSVLLSRIIDRSVQSWILEIWNKCTEVSIPGYSTIVYPKYHCVELSSNSGLIYFAMPAPRRPTEALYTAAIFLKNDIFSEWFRAYFTLELGLSKSAYWVLGEWDGSEHTNLGQFQYEPTAKNFLTVVIQKAKNKWVRSQLVNR